MVLRRKKLKIIIVVLVFIVLVIVMFYSCRGGGGNTDSLPLEEQFSCDINVKYDDMSFSCGVLKKAQGEYTVTITDPDELKDIEFKISDAGVQVSYYGFSIPLPDNALLQSSAISVIIEALDILSEAKDDYKMIGDNVVVSGEGSFGEYTATFRGDDGKLLSISVPKLDILIEVVTIN